MVTGQRLPPGLTSDDDAANLRVWKMFEEALRFQDDLYEFQEGLASFEDATVGEHHAYSTTPHTNLTALCACHQQT